MDIIESLKEEEKVREALEEIAVGLVDDVLLKGSNEIALYGRNLRWMDLCWEYLNKELLRRKKDIPVYIGGNEFQGFNFEVNVDFHVDEYFRSRNGSSSQADP